MGAPHMIMVPMCKYNGIYSALKIIENISEVGNILFFPIFTGIDKDPPENEIQSNGMLWHGAVCMTK